MLGLNDDPKGKNQGPVSRLFWSEMYKRGLKPGLYTGAGPAGAQSVLLSHILIMFYVILFFVFCFFCV